MLSDHCLSRLVCDVGALWPNGWMDQDETCHGDRPQPDSPSHIVLDVGLGRFGFFKFGSIRFGFQSQVLGFGFFSVSVFAHHHNARVSQCVKTLTRN